MLNTMLKITMMIVKIKIDKTINYGYVGDSTDDDNDNHDNKSTAA